MRQIEQDYRSAGGRGLKWSLYALTGSGGMVASVTALVLSSFGMPS